MAGGTVGACGAGAEAAVIRLLVGLLATSAYGATITAPGFTVGPVTFSNVSYTSTASAGLPEMGFVFAPALFPNPDFPGRVGVFVSGNPYGLSGAGVPKFASETLTADFVVTDGYAVTAVGAIGNIGDDGSIAVSEDIFLIAPCSAVLSHLNRSGGCAPAAPLTSGTLSIGLTVRAGECPGSICFGFGSIGPATAVLTLQPAIHNPEPGTWAMMLLGGIMLRRLRHGSTVAPPSIATPDGPSCTNEPPES